MAGLLSFLLMPKVERVHRQFVADDLAGVIEVALLDRGLVLVHVLLAKVERIVGSGLQIAVAGQLAGLVRVGRVALFRRGDVRLLNPRGNGRGQR